MLCSWLSESLAAAGFSDEQLTTEATIDFSDVHGEHKPWKDIFGAGQGVGAIDRSATVAEVAEQIIAEYSAAIQLHHT